MIVHGEIRRAGRVVVTAGAVDAPAGAVVGLIGINGAGKSSLMLHLAGVLRNAPAPAYPVGFAPQRPTFPAWLDAAGISRLFGFEFSTLSARYPGLLLNEIEHLRGGVMSVGQTQTLSIALALALDSPVILLDEPFAPLDFRRRIGLQRILAARGPDAGMAIVSSQSAAEVMDVCSWIVVMNGGRYVYAGPVADLAGSGAADEQRQRLERGILELLTGCRAQPASG